MFEVQESIRNLPKGLCDWHPWRVWYWLHRLKAKLWAVLLSWVCLLFHCLLFSSLRGAGVSANGSGEVTFVHGVLGCHSHAVGGRGFQFRLGVKITLHSSHYGRLIGPLLRCLLNNERVLRRVRHRPPLDRNGQSAHFSDKHFWCFQVCQNQKSLS